MVQQPIDIILNIHIIMNIDIISLLNFIPTITLPTLHFPELECSLQYVGKVSNIAKKKNLFNEFLSFLNIIEDYNFEY